MITIDTLRADRLSSYGYERATSPRLDELAADSIRFTNATTPRSATAPSLASMFTGLYPYEHGVVTNLVPVDESLWTLPEILKRAGYETAAFVSNYVLIREFSNMDQGFDVYDDFVTEREPNRAVYERKAGKTVDAALRWLQKRSKKPFFLWVHLIDPHGPYDAPASQAKRFGPSSHQPLSRRSIPNYQYLGSTDAAFYLDRYDAEIAYADSQIGRLLDALRERGSYDDSLILFHADHGEDFGEHGVWFEHGTFVYEATNRIPLLLKLPSRKRTESDRADRDPAAASPSKTCDLLVSVMDIEPTVLDVLGLSPPVKPDGKSLLKLLRERNEVGGKAERFLFMDTLGMPRAKTYVGLRGEHAKLVYRVSPKGGFTVLHRQFFDLQDDLEEQRNLFPSTDPLQIDMQKRLGDWLARVRSYERPFETTHWKPPDGDAFIKGRDRAEHVEELRQLGYVE